MKRISSRLFAAALVAGVAGSGAVAASASATAATPSGGPIHIWATPSPKGAGGRILLTGAIADHGTTQSVNAQGAPDPNGGFVKVTLSRGGFEVDKAALDRRLNALKPVIDRATCSAWGTGTGEVTLQGGTGAYAGIRGTARMTVTFAVIAPRYTSGRKQGQCNLNKTTAMFESSITGVGSVSF
ncbi:MAG TPA: hypothetical protein VMF07_20945 [Solirubrobacteraceae bacterium]|nr:hypothetical protein [Solirubrobacteraceae bacterium]